MKGLAGKALRGGVFFFFFSFFYFLTCLGCARYPNQSDAIFFFRLLDDIPRISKHAFIYLPIYLFIQ